MAFFGAHSLPSQLAWALVLMLILAGIFLSYSRGGFVALALLGVLCGAMGLLPPRSMAAAFVLILLLAPLAAPDYLGRIMSLSTAKNLTSRENAGQADGAIRGRATEMLAAANVFTDHPLIGVQWSGANTHLSTRSTTSPIRTSPSDTFPKLGAPTVCIWSWRLKRGSSVWAFFCSWWAA